MRVPLALRFEAPPRKPGQHRTNHAHLVRRTYERLAAVEHYGGRCRCCQRTDRLSVYAIDGRSHFEVVKGRPQGRDDKGLRAGEFMRWLTIAEYPPGFEVLCVLCGNRVRTPFGCSPADHDRDETLGR